MLASLALAPAILIRRVAKASEDYYGEDGESRFERAFVTGVSAFRIDQARRDVVHDEPRYGPRPLVARQRRRVLAVLGRTPWSPGVIRRSSCLSSRANASMPPGSSCSLRNPSFNERIRRVVNDEIRFDCMLEKYFQGREQKRKTSG